MNVQGTLILAITIILFVLKFSIGFNTELKQLRFFSGRSSLLFRSLLADIILVPVFAIGLVKLFGLPLGISTSLLLLSASPGAPLASVKVYQAKGDFSYGISLQLLLTLLAMLTVPAWLSVYNVVFEIGAHALPWKVAGQLGYAVLLPLGLGLLARRFFPEWGRRYGLRFAKLTHGLIVLFGLVLLVLLYRYIIDSPWIVYLAFGGFLLLALVTGHILGGPKPAYRTTLATMTSTRNLGIAMFIAAQNFEQQKILAMIIPYLIIVIIVSMGYGTWRKRKLSVEKPN